ncbi:unnamed protein product [Ceutorhynchus assimilis]|uniref:C2H2-type domain-containing protein n=1 Tax=Ceutorhynchus assimilis TaxID=467358 RepID=A0A9N9QJU2_9CUCU|nr:unnamed protein product [Ceutorhynchus assimilis]
MGLKMSTKKPLVVILGSTGTGKTKLSLELAARFNGEIIGADSMQVYKELDIVSAKATKQELSTVPHHMINILNPHEKFTVLEYRNRVLPVIDDIFKRDKLPIIVGGTNYYIESILWKILVQEPHEKLDFEVGVLPNNEHKLSSRELHEKLTKLDPVSAKRLHPNNKRKIMRSLEVLYQQGKKHSDILEEQGNGSKSGGGLRYDNVVVFWLRCCQEVLNKRLDDRVDKMIEDGLLEELMNFHKLYNEERLKDNSQVDYTKGIFQTIGFKEFHEYLMLNQEEKDSELGKKKLEEGLEKLKIGSKRYSKKQTKWVINRFLARKDRQVPPIYSLDSTSLPLWEKCVAGPSVLIVQSYLSKTACEIQPIPLVEKESVPYTSEMTYSCKVCDKVLVSSQQFEIHMKSRRHRNMLERVSKIPK